MTAIPALGAFKYFFNISHNYYLFGIGGHDPNSKDKDELGHVPSFLSAYSLCNSDSNSISVNSYILNYIEKVLRSDQALPI